MTGSPLVLNDVLKSLHIALLQMLPEHAGKFWKGHALDVEGRTLSESAKLRHIWEENARSPLDFLNRVLQSLEPFLLERGIPVEDFVARMSYWSNRGSFLSARFMLKTLNPLLSRLFSASDLMSFILTLMGIVGAKLVKGMSFPILDKVTVGGEKHVYTMILVPELFTTNLTKWDGEMFSARLLQVKPKAFGLPPYSDVALMSDARTPEEVLWEGGPERDGDRFLIGGRACGKANNFFSYCTGHGLNVSTYGLPSAMGIVMDPPTI